MSAEALLTTLLAPLVSGRMYPDVAPLDSDLPRIVYQQVGGDSVVFIEGTLPNTENARMQLACWATTRAAALDLAKQVETAIVASPAFQGRPISARVSDYEEDTELYGARQDFSIWSTR